MAGHAAPAAVGRPGPGGRLRPTRQLLWLPGCGDLRAAVVQRAVWLGPAGWAGRLRRRHAPPSPGRLGEVWLHLSSVWSVALQPRRAPRIMEAFPGPRV